MPRKIQGSRLESATSRMELRHRTSPHRQRLSPGLGIGYYKPAEAGVAGTWVVLFYDENANPKETRKKIGTADDFALADGITIFSWEQAQDKVRAWRKARIEGVKEGQSEAPKIGPHLVDHAWEDYILDAKARGVKGIKIMSQCYAAHVRPVLGQIDVAALTESQIQNWMIGLSETPKRTGKKPVPEGESDQEGETSHPGKVGNKETSKRIGKKPAPEGKSDQEGETSHPDQVGNKENPEATAKVSKPAKDPKDVWRARQDSTNRVYSNLKAALNLAARRGKAGAKTPWREVQPFQKTSSSRITALSSDEKKKLIAACSPELRPLVIAALFSGARYGELILVRVKDFQGETLHIEYGKGKGIVVPRDVRLSKQAQAWFRDFTQGRPREELMFKRHLEVRRTKRTELQDWEGWASYDQIYAMQQAVALAGVTPVTFHELRHTFASDLLNNGLSLKFLAKQLGHADTRMVDRYYGHIAEAAMQAEVERCSPILEWDA